MCDNIRDKKLKAVTPKKILIFEDSSGKKPFVEWLKSLDKKMQARIEQRILRLELGNYGDYKALKDGISELRFKFGSGYRVYFAKDGDKIVILISGGDKSTQSNDIKKAIEYWQEYKND